MIASTDEAISPASSVACPDRCVNVVSTSTCSRSTRSTAEIRSPVTCVEYGLTIRSARFTLPSMPRRTALIVEVPEAEPAVFELRLRHASSAAAGVPAHITILFPFMDGADVDEEALAGFFSRFRVFDFVLDHVERFQEGIVWLHPEPSLPFVDLTAAVEQRWPDYPPYEG